MPKKISVYEAKDGTLHRTPEAASEHELQSAVRSALFERFNLTFEECDGSLLNLINFVEDLKVAYAAYDPRLLEGVVRSNLETGC